MKVCSKCGLAKPVSEFNKDKTASSGLRSACKLCQSEYQRKRNARPEIKARKKEYDKAHNALPAVRARKKECGKKYGQEYRSRINVRARTAYLKAEKKYRMDMTEEEYREVYLGACVISGVEPACGVDRIDSSLGYTVENTQPMSIFWNKAKSNIVTNKEMIDHIYQAFRHQQIKDIFHECTHKKDN